MSVALSRREAFRLISAAAMVTAAGGVPAAMAATRDPVTVFAAASLTDVFESIGARHESETGQRVRSAFASSSALARQIEAGAPAHIFASAHEHWMDHVEQLGLIAPGTRASPIGNRLVLIAPADSSIEPVKIGPETDLVGLLNPGDRIALGNPEHVPAGLYARQALRHLGLWQTTARHLAHASHVRAAVALVETGEAPLGIVYATDAAVSDGVRIVGRFSENSQPAISYPFAIIAGQDTPEVRVVYEALLSFEAKTVFEAAGFTVR